MSNNINHEIKTIVAELQSMSPRTQLEIVRLCKRVAELTPDYIEDVTEEITDTQYAAFTAALNQATTQLQSQITTNANDIDALEVRAGDAEDNIETNANVIAAIAKNNHLIFENIYDKNVHNRFIEGNINLSAEAATAGLLKSYGKWSLSGSHLMLALCVEIPENVSFNASYLSYITLPTWIKNKIYPIIAGGGDFIGYNTISILTENSYSVPLPSLFTSLRVWSGDSVVISVGGISATNSKRAFRIQFDLLIDNE